MFKLLNKKLLKRKNGFTMIELMIVIAIIGVLALVLIPQAAKMKDNAKLAGVDANMRMVQAHIEAVIDDCADASKLSAAIAARVDTSISNPFDKEKKDVATDTTGTTAYATQSAVIIYQIGTDTGVASDTAFASGGNTKNAAMAGSVVVSIYTPTGGKLTAELYGYDSKGNPITPTDKNVIITK